MAEAKLMISEGRCWPHTGAREDDKEERQERKGKQKKSKTSKKKDKDEIEL